MGSFYREGEALSKNGLALIATIMFIVFVSIAALSVTVFIVQWFSEMNAEVVSTKCLYLAQAGVHDAIYDVRSTYNGTTTFGYYSLGVNTVNPGETYRRGGTASDLLMINTANVSTSGSDLTGLRLQCATNSVSPAVIVDRMIVSWTQTGAARRLSSIVIGGVSLWSGNLSSPANANITNVTLSTVISAVTRIRFSGNVNNFSGITIQWVMTDGSTKTVVCFPASANCPFTIKSTGKVAGSNIYRTESVDYNLRSSLATARIDRQNEINTEITAP